jgi:hypothetical protein
VHRGSPWGAEQEQDKSKTSPAGLRLIVARSATILNRDIAKKVSGNP